MVWHEYINPRYDKKCKNIKWTKQMEEKLQCLIKQEEDKGKQINWCFVSQQLNKSPWSCYNKYLQLNDHQWTIDEENRLGQLYEKSRSQRGFELQNYQQHFPKHKLKMILFKLEQITRWNRFKPKFTIPESILRKID